MFYRTLRAVAIGATGVTLVPKIDPDQRIGKVEPDSRSYVS